MAQKQQTNPSQQSKAKKPETGKPKMTQREQRRAEQRRKQQQTWLIIGALAFLLIAAVGWAIWDNATAGDRTQSATLPAEVTIDEAYQLVQDGAFLLDVREQYEWDEFHATGATLIPLGELASRVNEVPQDQEIVVICNSGNRSQEGRDILLNAGFPNVTSAAGGVQAWRSAGYPTE